MSRLINATLFLIILICGCTTTYKQNTNIPKNGILRVGMTGDYPPLTYYDPKTKSYSGYTIDIARKLGKHLNVEICFVKTSWPTLSDDLKSDKFDIAMGGITATSERAKDFILSDPVTYTGKIPLIRKADRKKYLSLKEIDKPNVTVVENLGGTNLQFAKNNIFHAKLVVVPENKMAFEYLLQKKADVMFTDNIEAVYRQKIMPALYAVNPDQPYTHTAKVYLMNKNNVKLSKKINKCLDLIKKKRI
jgi:cyclohexadienyl dehydratase